MKYLSSKLFQSITARATLVLSTLALIAGGLVTSYLMSRLGRIHGKELPESYFSDGYPSILPLLDSQWFMGFIALVTIAILVYVLYLLWQLHEIAVHKAKSMSSAHTQIVFALSLCGLFIDKVWWVLAIIIAFTRWDVVANGIASVIRKGVHLDEEKKS